MNLMEILRSEWGDVKAWIFSVTAFILVNIADIFSLKSRIGETPALLIYGLATIFVYLLIAATYEWLIVRSVKIVAAPMQLSSLPPPLRGMRYYASLNVEIPEGWEVTDCYVTLERELMIYDEDRVLLKPEFSTWIAHIEKPTYKMLRWLTPLDPGYKITIGENSNTESILVGMISLGSVIDANGRHTEIKTFSYCLYGDTPTTIRFHGFGLRQLSVAFHWKRNGRRMPARTFNGYLYSGVEDSSPKIIIGQGDFRRNKAIPKALPMPVEAQQGAS